MKIRIKKTWLVAVGSLLAMTAAGGVALAVEDPDDWYEGGNATVADPHLLDTPLHLYSSGGTAVTSGSTSGALAAFAAADGAVRAGDEFATLFVHVAQSDAAPGAWPGLQLTSTDKFDGTSGVLTHPGALNGKPFAGIGAGDYSLADVIAALPNVASGDALKGVYELRLRTSSTIAGVSDKYAATWLRVNDAKTQWQEIAKPDLGGGTPTTTPPTSTPPTTPAAVNTSVAPSWPSSLTYGTPSSFSVTVNPASGSAKPTGTVRLLSGSTQVATATLSGGAASFTVPATALTPGAKTLKVAYSGASNAFNASESANQTVTVGKATPGTPTYKTDKAPTTKKKGSATVTVPVPGGLAAAGGTASVVITKGSVTKTVKVTVVNGKATVKLPKLPAGKWRVTVTYDGDGNYLTATSKGVKLKVKAPKPKPKG